MAAGNGSRWELNCLPAGARERLDTLLRPPLVGIEAGAEDDPAASVGTRALLNFAPPPKGKPVKNAIGRFRSYPPSHPLAILVAAME